MRASALTLVTVLAVASWAGLAAAGETHEVRVVAHEDPAECVADEGPCLAVPADDWSLVSEGDELVVAFENNASRSHGLAIVRGELADGANGTSAEDAFLHVDAIEPGQSVEARATVPNGTGTAHLFCHVGDHEQEGMHLTRNVYPAGSVEQARERGPGLDEPGRVPFPPGLALAGLVGALLVGRRRG